MLRAVCLAGLALSCVAPPEVRAEGPSLEASAVPGFLGTWALTMTNPAGAAETVRIWSDDGMVKASVQVGRFPARVATGLVKDGDLLVLTLSFFENGHPVWGVAALSLEGDTLHMAKMLQQSETIKRGSGKRVAVPPMP